MSTAWISAPGSLAAIAAASAPAPQPRSTTTRAPGCSRAATSTTAAARARGTKTPSATATVTPANSAAPTACSSGIPRTRAATACSTPCAVCRCRRTNAASASGSTHPAARSRATIEASTLRSSPDALIGFPSGQQPQRAAVGLDRLAGQSVGEPIVGLPGVGQHRREVVQRRAGRAEQLDHRLVGDVDALVAPVLGQLAGLTVVDDVVLGAGEHLDGHGGLELADA